MAIFDVPFKVAYDDYYIYCDIATKAKLPVEVVTGETETNKTIKQITSYVGDVSSYIDELI